VKEFSFPLDDSLKVGLIPTDKIRRNTPGLLECYNLKSTKEGLLEYTPIVNPYTYDGTWPFLQLFNTRTGVYAADATHVYEVDSGNNLSVLGDDLTVGNLWSMADFYTYQVWVNGNGCAVLDPTTSTLTAQTLTHIIESVCNYKGQLIAGGFGGNQSNWVAWSGIGKTYLTELLDKEDISNVTGQMPVGWFGDVYVVKRLGEYVMVYGSGGVSALRPISSPVTGFGLRVMLEYGIASKGCIGGDEYKHLFIDNEGALWSAVENVEFKTVQLSRLGYKQFMANLTAADIVISHDPIGKDFYISDGVRTYLYSDGLSEVYQIPSGIVRVGGYLYGYLFDTATADTSAYITTNSFDIGLRAIKTITSVEAGFTGSQVLSAIDYAYGTNTSMKRSRYKIVNKQGNVTPIVSGVDFKVHMKANSHVGFEIDNMTVRWKLSDKRSIRGAYGNQGSM
jgi:hypothetical protein